MSLIKQAHQVLLENQITLNNIITFANSIDVDLNSLCESVTHVLAGLEKTAQNMNPRSVAAFLAGIEKISTVLPSANVQPDKKQNTIRLLTAAAMKFDDLTKQTIPNASVVKIAQYGAGDAQLIRKYLDIVQQGPEAISTAANQLRVTIDRVITTSGQLQQNSQPVLKLQPQSQPATSQRPGKL